MENNWKVDINETMDSKGKIKKGEWNSELLPKEVVIGKYFRQDKEVLSTTLCKFDKTASLNAPSLLELKPTTTPFYKI